MKKKKEGAENGRHKERLRNMKRSEAGKEQRSTGRRKI
jgi:hypothetical protein